jgi:hypothetical protein
MIDSNSNLQQTVFPDKDRSNYKEFDVIRFVKLNRKLPAKEYGTFLFHCVVAIAGVDRTIPILENWNETSKINEIVTPSDEAFALTLLVNYWDQFLANWDKSVPARFRDRKLEKGTSPTGKRKMQGGWSAEGMALFNELYNLVKKNRAEEDIGQVAAPETNAEGSFYSQEESQKSFNDLFGETLWTVSEGRYGYDPTRKEYVQAIKGKRKRVGAEEDDDGSGIHGYIGAREDV